MQGTCLDLLPNHQMKQAWVAKKVEDILAHSKTWVSIQLEKTLLKYSALMHPDPPLDYVRFV